MPSAPEQQVVRAHERRLAELDPLLAIRHPLPDPLPGDAVLRVEGGVGVARRDQVDPASLNASWGALDRHRLLARVGGGEPAMEALLARWRERVLGQARPDDPDSAALVTWPSRDVTQTARLLSYGMAPATVVAARPAGRQSPGGGPAETPGVPVRRLAKSDLDQALQLWLEVVRWDSQFQSVVERPSTEGQLRQELVEELERDDPWSWVAEVDGQLAGLLMASPPARSGWVAPLVAGSATAYLGCLVVTASRRGSGVGAALVQHGHAALDAAGVETTLLHYAGLNPLSGPFWHRCGYRPVWTTWQARPASRLGG